MSSLTPDDARSTLQQVTADAQVAFARARTEDELNQIKATFLGKSGPVNDIMKGLGQVAPAERAAIGQVVNAARQELEGLLEHHRERLRAERKAARIAAVQRDLSLVGRGARPGAQHPLARVEDEIIRVFEDMGYAVATGPQIETDFHNFGALNFPDDHPARDMQDTFMLPGGRLLRTHTSPVQIRAMLANRPPIRVCSPGPVFRVDTPDMTHSPNFRQVEGLLVDRNVTLADLKGTLKEFSSRLFGRELNVRFRPSFFPFTEPSVEADVECPFCEDGCRTCKGTRWIEILGAGMVDPAVFVSAGVDPEQWQGFAFGIGVERVAMLLYGVDDIRLFFENDVRFLGQFPA
jgi:phenylalanyl-tRNA synthetase alpha chain